MDQELTTPRRPVVSRRFLNLLKQYDRTSKQHVLHENNAHEITEWLQSRRALLAYVGSLESKPGEDQ